MADFVAVLKKTIEGLSENTPEVRAKVYAKARATIDSKLAAINPPPPAAVAERQRQAIEDAIQAVEQFYAPVPEEEDELDSFFGNYGADGNDAPEPSVDPDPFAPRQGLPRAEEFSVAERMSGSNGSFGDHSARDDDDDREAPLPQAVDDDPRERAFPTRPAAPRRRMSGGLLAAAVALVILAGGAYAGWSNQEALTQFLGLNDDGADGSDVAEGTDLPDDAEANQEPEADIAADDAAAPGDANAAAPEDEETDIAALTPGDAEQAAPEAPAAAEAAPEAAPPSEPLRKYTQRLQADGSEVDAGPANGGLSIGEGTSVAELTQTAQAAQGQEPTATDAAPPAASPAAPTAAAPSAPPSVAVGQRAIFYEERTSTAPATAENGSIVWSVVQESPGGDAPPEPAIRAEATIPGRDMQLRMTIRRNADPTLPASHIMEMIFLTPEGAEGGGIQNVVRVAMKDSEQATGSPLLGIPAKIADGFFLVALSDSPAEIQANLTLLRRQDWIDVPLIYTSGRRALITMEKGVPGERVFEEALKAWQDASSG
jgi:hypothetical protein